jgi:serpin B
MPRALSGLLVPFLPAIVFAAAACASSPNVPVPAPSSAPPSPPPPKAAPAPTAAAPTAAAPPATPVADDPADVRAANSFTTKLYTRIKHAPGNALVSGASARHALALAALGARGETAREMSSALELPADVTQQIAFAKAETATWQQAHGKAELVVADRLWSDKAFTPKNDFTSAAHDAFGAGVEPVDFAHASDAARKTINAWVAEKTSDKIKDLLAEGTVDARTRVVVTNAIYFKGRWAEPFTTGSTKNEKFTTAPGKSADVPMMHETDRYGFAHVGSVKLLGMGYADSQLSMLVVLPDDATGLSKLEDSLSADTFATWTKALTSQRVAVSLPRFKFQFGGSLDAPLQALGLKSAFTSKADFSGIADPAAGGERLQISHVVQKTWVSVDENGTEAAAATGAVMTVTSMPMGPVADFKADHPFLFFVYDAKGGRILFAGRVADPRS